MPELAGITSCPACGSARIATMPDGKYSFCVACRKAWEPIPCGESFTVDGEPLPFATPCDTCAFRGKSPERRDGDMWDSLQFSLANGGQFYCHKGVPFVVDPAAPVVDGAISQPFEYPKKPGGGYDLEHMRICRGYLNQHVGPVLKRYAKS